MKYNLLTRYSTKFNDSNIFADSYRSFYPDYSCYRYRRDAKDNAELVVSEVAKIVKINKKSNPKINKKSKPTKKKV